MVNYTNILLDCIKTVEKEGFQLIDVPYYVSKEVSEYTKPYGINDLHHNKELVYVGSGEQSFLELIKNNKLHYGTFACITPCFRDEEVLDDLHLKVFLKLELIDYIEPDDASEEFARTTLDNIIEIMFNFYKDNFGLYNFIEVAEVLKDKQYDILINGDEVGSYGIRKTLDGELYVYGTGVTLPRLQVVIESNKGE